MPTPVRNRLPEVVPSLEGFEGIINTKRTKDIGYGGLTIGRNVEITDAKKLLRRDGYKIVHSGPYAGLYGSKDQQTLLVVRNGDLVTVGASGGETVLGSGLDDGLYSWDEDAAANIYFTSSKGSNGVVRNDGVYLPLSLAVPVISSVAAIDTAPWIVTPFNLGKTYDQNAVHVFATYLYPDGRESAPSGVVSIQVAPEVSLIQMSVPVQAGCKTAVYATAPGGSRYYLVAVATTPGFTFPTYFLQTQATGEDYPYTTVLESFPAAATVLAFDGGHLYAGLYDPSTRYGVVYCSLPLQYHLFDKTADFIPVGGTPLLLLAIDGGLLIGTDSNVFLWNGEKLQTLTGYGVLPGTCGDAAMDGKAYFWTERGIAKAMPYELVTEEKYSADPGVFNHAKIFYEHGYAKLVASTVSGNVAFNKWSAR
jgi:hypothetical protein